MIELIGRDEMSPECDGCGNTTIAQLNIHGIYIPLCETCVKELTEEIKKFNDTVFCYKCKHFIRSESGFNYGGSCKWKASKDGKELTDKNAGYDYITDSMDTCTHAKL